jgi:hypothetical protein
MLKQGSLRCRQGVFKYEIFNLFFGFSDVVDTCIHCFIGCTMLINRKSSIGYICVGR